MKFEYVFSDPACPLLLRNVKCASYLVVNMVLSILIFDILNYFCSHLWMFCKLFKSILEEFCFLDF